MTLGALICLPVSVATKFAVFGEQELGFNSLFVPQVLST